MTIYYVKKDLFTNKPILKTANKNNKGLNLAAWSDTEKEAWLKFEAREKARIEKERINIEKAEKEFKAFKSELGELLGKYGASIFWSCGASSDTHGIYDENLCAEIGGFNFEIVEGDTISTKDLKNS